MDDLTFLEDFGGDYGAGNATLKVVLADGNVHHISDRISPYRLLDACPLLFHAFEYGSQSRLQASIEAPSRAAVISLLRYCYTGSYLYPGAEYAPILLLPHAEMYKMAEDFDVPELQLLAHGNFSVQIDCACSLPMPPQDLLETIRYVYLHFASPQSCQQQGLTHSLLNYCISNFLYHKLGDSVEFLEVARQIPEFRQDLCRTNMERNFQDDCALEIVGLALDTLQPRPGFHPTTLASRDLPEEMLFDRPATPSHATAADLIRDILNPSKTGNDSEWKSTDEATTQCNSMISGPSTLVYRPKHSVVDTSFEIDSSSEDEGFSIVHRPRSRAIVMPDEPMSSPEIIPSDPIDVLALTGSNYADDDEWDLL